MKASQSSDAQKASTVKQAENETSVAEVCRKARVSQAAYAVDKLALDAVHVRERAVLRVG